MGRGLTPAQAGRRAVIRALATAGFVEVLTFPWASQADLDALGVPADDERRNAVRLVNPLADTAPLLRTTMLPGLFAALQRNASRGADDLALAEVGSVFFDAGDEPTPSPGVAQRPTDVELAGIAATLPGSRATSARSSRARGVGPAGRGPRSRPAGSRRSAWPSWSRAPRGWCWSVGPRAWRRGTRAVARPWSSTVR